MPPVVSVTHFTDPGCPWAWSASPALAALRWRYGDQLTLTMKLKREPIDQKYAEESEEMYAG